jgi:hypothetical protein
MVLPHGAAGCRLGTSGSSDRMMRAAWTSIEAGWQKEFSKNNWLCAQDRCSTELCPNMFHCETARAYILISNSIKIFYRHGHFIFTSTLIQTKNSHKNLNKNLNETSNENSNKNSNVN